MTVEYNNLKNEPKFHSCKFSDVIENYNIQMDNLLHEISEYEEILKIEYGPLIKSSIKKVFRQIEMAWFECG